MRLHLSTFRCGQPPGHRGPSRRALQAPTNHLPGFLRPRAGAHGGGRWRSLARTDAPTSPFRARARRNRDLHLCRSLPRRPGPGRIRWCGCRLPLARLRISQRQRDAPVRAPPHGPVGAQRRVARSRAGRRAQKNPRASGRPRVGRTGSGRRDQKRTEDSNLISGSGSSVSSIMKSSSDGVVKRNWPPKRIRPFRS